MNFTRARVARSVQNLLISDLSQISLQFRNNYSNTLHHFNIARGSHPWFETHNCPDVTFSRINRTVTDFFEEKEENTHYLFQFIREKILFFSFSKRQLIIEILGETPDLARRKAASFLFTIIEDTLNWANKTADINIYLIHP